MKLDIDEIKAGIIADVSAAVVAKLPEEAKAEIVAVALEGVITNYHFKTAVEAQLKVVADKKLNELLQTIEFDKRLCTKFQEGLDLFMQALPKAVAAAMVGTLVGPREYKSGAIYKGMCDVLGIDRE